ncbi:metal-dependent hydrolase [Marivivens marinus]|uniref:metal-dependent hydrolase n=1 Tax=Marivivens marinus TaxID=3110173 RepID=UPI003B845553
MKITWLGHSGFRIEIEDQVLLIDPWMTGNPAFPEGREAEAVAGVTAILLTHGHGDHAANAIGIARDHGVPIACIHELAELLGDEDGVQAIGFGKGGTIFLGKAWVSMVHALHSSSVDFRGGVQYAGGEAGFIIRGEDHSIYVSGDTDVMADMEVIADRYKPDIGILCAGGHYTMDMEGAAYAARRFFDFDVVIPCHYKTFPILAQDAEDLKNGLPANVRLIEPSVLEPISL